MTTQREADVISADVLRERLGPKYWGEAKPHGEDSWMIDGPDRRVIVSIDNYSEPGVPWIHASISYLQEWRMPSYSDMKQLHAAVFGDGHAYECFVPPGEHINIRGNVRQYNNMGCPEIATTCRIVTRTITLSRSAWEPIDSPTPLGDNEISEETNQEVTS